MSLSKNTNLSDKCGTGPARGMRAWNARRHANLRGPPWPRLPSQLLECNLVKEYKLRYRYQGVKHFEVKVCISESTILGGEGFDHILSFAIVQSDLDEFEDPDATSLDLIS